MNKQYISKKNGYTFSTLTNEKCYTCPGSCTCKYICNRTDYDKMQNLQYSQHNNTNYENIMYKSFKKKY